MPYAPISELDREKYRELWRAVVFRAIEDLYIHAEKSNYSSNLAWFSLENDDFQTVCAFAELDEQKIINIAKVWEETRDKKIVRLMMLKEKIVPPTDKDKFIG